MKKTSIGFKIGIVLALLHLGLAMFTSFESSEMLESGYYTASALVFIRFFTLDAPVIFLFSLLDLNETTDPLIQFGIFGSFLWFLIPWLIDRAVTYISPNSTWRIKIIAIIIAIPIVLFGFSRLSDFQIKYSIKQERPEELKKMLNKASSDIFTERIVFEDVELGDVSSITRMNCRPGKEEEILLGTSEGVVFFNTDYQEQHRVNVPTADGFFNSMKPLEIDENRTCGFLGYLHSDSAHLFDLSGQEIWRLESPIGSIGIAGVRFGDIDGEGDSEFATYYVFEAGGIQLFDKNGKQRWIHPLYNPPVNHETVGEVEFANILADGKTGIIYNLFGNGGKFTFLDVAGNVVKQINVPVKSFHFTMVNWPNIKESPNILVAEEKKIKVINFQDSTILELDAPGSESFGDINAISVKFDKDAPEYLAVRKNLSSDLAVLYIYDGAGNLVYQKTDEVKMNPRPALAAIPTDTGAEKLLVGSEKDYQARIFEYSLSSKAANQEVLDSGKKPSFSKIDLNLLTEKKLAQIKEVKQQFEDLGKRFMEYGDNGLIERGTDFRKRLADELNALDQIIYSAQIESLSTLQRVQGDIIRIDHEINQYLDKKSPQTSKSVLNAERKPKPSTKVHFKQEEEVVMPESLQPLKTESEIIEGFIEGVATITSEENNREADLVIKKNETQWALDSLVGDFRMLIPYKLTKEDPLYQETLETIYQARTFFTSETPMLEVDLEVLSKKIKTAQQKIEDYKNRHDKADWDDAILVTIPNSSKSLQVPKKTYDYGTIGADVWRRTDGTIRIDIYLDEKTKNGDIIQYEFDEAGNFLSKEKTEIATSLEVSDNTFEVLGVSRYESDTWPRILVPQSPGVYISNGLETLPFSDDKENWPPNTNYVIKRNTDGSLELLNKETGENHQFDQEGKSKDDKYGARMKAAEAFVTKIPRKLTPAEIQAIKSWLPPVEKHLQGAEILQKSFNDDGKNIQTRYKLKNGNIIHVVEEHYGRKTDSVSLHEENPEGEIIGHKSIKKIDRTITISSEFDSRSSIEYRPDGTIAAIYDNTNHATSEFDEKGKLISIRLSAQ